jgi:hypothetical protein
LRDELKANLYGLPQKRHILNQMLGALSKAELLSGESVPFSSKIYDAHFATVSAKLTVQERNSLHVIYTSLMMIDSTMKTATEKIMDKYDSEAFKDIVALEKGKLHDMKKVMDVTEQIIQKHLAGTPVDVMHLGSDYEKVKAQFGRH